MRVVQYEDQEYYYFVLYAHLSKLNTKFDVTKIPIIPSGAILGLSGDSGAPGEPHLDYGLYKIRKDYQIAIGKKNKSLEQFLEVMEPGERSVWIYNRILNDRKSPGQDRPVRHVYAVNPLDPDNWPRENQP